MTRQEGFKALQKQAAVKPATAKQRIENRKLPGNVFDPKNPRRKVKGQFGGVMAATPGFATNTVAGPASIAELARALKHDVDLIMEFVYQNIEWIPTYGSQKGALGCLIDGTGNSFDISELMIELLRDSAAYDADFQLGELEMTVADAAVWLGTDENIWAIVNLLADGGIPCEEYWTGSEWKIRISHCFVKVDIGGTDYVFDPAMKSYSTISGMNLETALDYDSTDFMDNATDGATIHADYVQDINRTNVRDDLATLTGNLVDYIKTNNPDATMDDVLGGRKIDALTSQMRDTAHPHLRPSTTPTTWTDIPNAYKATLNVAYDTIDETFYSKDIHGKRLSLFFNGSHEAELRLDGTLIDTSSAQTPDSWNSVWLEVVHPYADTFADEGHWQTVWEGHPYLIAQAWGNAGRKMTDLHLDRYHQAVFDGGAVTDEDVFGSQLAVLWHEWNSKKSRACDMLNRMTNCVTVLHHQTGLVGHFDTPFTDLGGIVWASSALDNDWDNVDTNDTALAMHGIAFEAGAIEQITGLGGLSSTTLIDLANSNGDKIYDGRPDNWTDDVRPNLTNYSSQTLDDIESWWIDWDWRVAIPEDGDLTQNSWNGYGYYAISPWYGTIGIITGGLKGGSGDEGTQCFTDNCPLWKGDDPKRKRPPGWGAPKPGEPINAFTGEMLYDTADFAVGSARTPYGLEFSRSYNSGNRLEDGPLGLGWSHNHHMLLATRSDGLASLASESPVQGAAGIAQMYVTVDLYRDLDKPLDKWVVAAIANKWLVDQSAKNVVRVTTGTVTHEFVKLPDGSYARPLGSAFDLIDNQDDTFTMQTPQQVEYNFDENGNIETIVYPFGMTLTYSYTSGKLTSVSNGLGRTLTLSYTGDRLTGVSDGNGRSIEFAFDQDGNLETYTDAEDEDTVYEYDQPGRMTKVFLPANPTSPMFINTFDSLNRVKEQKDAYNNTWKYYLAGYRAEEENAEGDSQIWYMNPRGVTLSHTNEVGKKRTFQLDGLDRIVKVTQPEGNNTEFVFDENNNVLTVTAKAKPGSGLSDIVNSFTYHEDWNVVSTATDARLKTTEFSYDETTGNVVSIEHPSIDSQTPKVSFTWNSRGQMLSKTDQTGLQTQFNYDTSTEKLLSTVVNTNWLATIGGSASTNDVLTITVTDAGISGGSKAKNYTVVNGDSLENIAQGLADAINGDSELQDLDISAKVMGTIISLCPAAGNTTTFSQSTSGGATATITLAAGLELTTEFGHDSVGNVTSVTNARGDEAIFEFDDLRRMTKAIAPEPFEYETKFTYDENGNRTKVERFAGLDGQQQPIWQTSLASYTIDNLLATVTDPGSNVSEFGYNNLRLLSTTEDAVSRVVTHAYDAAKRLQTVIDPSTVVQATYTYSDNGLVATVEDGNDNVTEYERDGFDRLKKKIFPDDTFEQNNFDQYGRRTSVLTRAGDEIAFDYNDLGWLIEKAPDNMPTVTFEHDLAGRLKKVVTNVVSGNPGSGEFEYFFDSAGRLIKEEYPDGKQVQYQLDELGNVTRLTWPDNYYVERVFDELNRLTDIKLNGATGSALEFDYDPLSRRTKLTYENGVETDYGFEMDNDLNSLIHTFTGSSVEFTYGFNSAHELTSQAVDDSTFLWHPTTGGTVSYGAATNLNQYPSVGGDDYTYNDNGCLTDNDVWAFDYDTENQLISADDGATSSSYLYDPQSRQTQKNVDGTKTRYIHADIQLIAEYDGTSGDFQKRYVYGPSLDEVLLEIDDVNEITSLHHDRVGSIVTTTDDTGTVLNTYAYSSWGECADMNGTTFGFQGQRFDHETGLYFMKARHYDPAIGRFIQPDPIGYGDGLNLYKFAYNNANNFSDPLGLAADPNNRPWGVPDPKYNPPPKWGEYPYGDPDYAPPKPWGIEPTHTKNLWGRGWITELENGMQLDEFTPDWIRKLFDPKWWTTHHPADTAKVADDLSDWFPGVGPGKKLTKTALKELVRYLKDVGPGVYIFITKNGKVYVGKAQDIYTRIKKHIDTGKFDELSAATLETIKADIDRLFKVERETLKRVGGPLSGGQNGFPPTENKIWPPDR